MRKSYNLYLFVKGQKATLEPFLDATLAYRYAKNYAEEYPEGKAYVIIREITPDSDSLIGKIVYDSRTQTIVDNYGRYEVKNK